MKRFPKTLYVTVEHGSGGETWLAPHEQMPESVDTEPCAMYQLIQVAKIEVTRKFK